jgi:hypothetical protein
MSTPELSETERARLDAIEAAEPAPESLRERVARAIWEEAQATIYLTSGFEGEQRERIRQQRFLRLADAALAVIKGDPS